jgi:predicted 2-oxoglutarate/Fe(II)-dependent dioxygenase YbiX
MSPCLMWVQLRLEKSLKFWVVVCYAPTDYSGDQPKDAFYDAFSSMVVAIPARDLVLCMGISMLKWDPVLAGGRVC